LRRRSSSFILLHVPHTHELPTLPLHDALPILQPVAGVPGKFLTAAEYALLDELTELIIPADDHSPGARAAAVAAYIDGRLAESRSEEHTSELQSRFDLVCRLLLEKKKTI